MIELDHQFFELLNGGLKNPIFDAVLPWWRHKLFWAPAYVFMLFFILENFKKQAAVLIFGLVLTVAVADTLSSQVFKKTIKRPRPCHLAVENLEVHLLVRCGSGYSFTSSHATNHFAVAAFLFVTLGQFFPKARWLLILWAASIAFAQVYVGVHFPLDVVAGAMLGWLVGSALGRFVGRRGLKAPVTKQPSGPHPVSDA